MVYMYFNQQVDHENMAHLHIHYGILLSYNEMRNFHEICRYMDETRKDHIE